jgi:hypothetical protein
MPMKMPPLRQIRLLSKRSAGSTGGNVGHNTPLSGMCRTWRLPDHILRKSLPLKRLQIAAVPGLAVTDRTRRTRRHRFAPSGPAAPPGQPFGAAGQFAAKCSRTTQRNRTADALELPANGTAGGRAVGDSNSFAGTAILLLSSCLSPFAPRKPLLSRSERRHRLIARSPYRLTPILQRSRNLP